MPTLVHILARTALGLYPFRNGQGRIIDRSFLGRLRFDEKELNVRTSDGFYLTVMPNDHIGRHIVLTGKFDPTIAEVLLSFGKPKDQIFDIGANIGYVSTVLLARLSHCRIASVEPQPDVFEILVRNLRSVGGDRAIAIRAAISDHGGEGVLRVHATNRGASSLDTVREDRAPGTTIAVPLITGQELMDRSGFDRLDLVKIDVEGHEIPVLMTLAPLFQRHRPRAVLFEHEGEFVDEANPIRRLFDSLDYEIRGIVKSLVGWRLVTVDDLARDRRRAHDYVAMPKRRSPS